jgi:hypothetical protein
MPNGQARQPCVSCAGRWANAVHRWIWRAADTVRGAGWLPHVMEVDRGRRGYGIQEEAGTLVTSSVFWEASSFEGAISNSYASSNGLCYRNGYAYYCSKNGQKPGGTSTTTSGSLENVLPHCSFPSLSGYYTPFPTPPEGEPRGGCVLGGPGGPSPGICGYLPWGVEPNNPVTPTSSFFGPPSVDLGGTSAQRSLRVPSGVPPQILGRGGLRGGLDTSSLAAVVAAAATPSSNWRLPFLACPAAFSRGQARSGP